MLHRISSSEPCDLRTDPLAALQQQLENGDLDDPSCDEFLKAITEDQILQKQLRRMVVKRLKSSKFLLQQTEDFIQEIHLLFAQHLRRRHDLGFTSAKGKLRPFLAALGRNFCLQVMDKSRQRRTHKHVQLKHRNLSDDSWQRERFNAELRELVVAIPEPARTSVRLFVNGNSVAEIARQLNLSQRTIYRHLHRAVKTFQSVHSGKEKHF